ncbi:hypothetical protein BT96DRAFT_984404 [Gymnopus androsaceus JB14]|uniref:Uncharacterized protein n=1 Tax=Gymnopus androsaceus JB14 TaxID=1447944 RepID=A0A6A4ID18_9AGAR|nr:hypothetical protein BT96DRAFT_984404 [Gymnopus androsaceus JB14]
MLSQSPTAIPLSLDSSGSEQDLLESDSISSANTSFDEHILTGFGDISHSEINFMPSLPSEIIAERSPSHRRNAKRPLPPTFRKATAKKLEELEDFTSLFESLRDLRDERNGESPKPFVDAEKVQPRLPSNRKGTIRKIPAPLQISKEASQVSTDPSSPISPSKPFRGSAPLPRRSPLPRWDLLDSDVYLEGKQYKIRSS